MDAFSLLRRFERIGKRTASRSSPQIDERARGPYPPRMRNAAAGGLVFTGGFIMMVLEIIGARFLAKDFGSSFHVWVSQIGVVLIALALGYDLGGALADRWQR